MLDPETLVRSELAEVSDGEDVLLVADDPSAFADLLARVEVRSVADVIDDPPTRQFSHAFVVNGSGIPALERRLLPKILAQALLPKGTLVAVQRPEQLMAMPLILSRIVAPLETVDHVVYSYKKGNR